MEQKKRSDLVQKALIDLIGSNYEMFSSQDILVAAGISEEDFEKYKTDVEQGARALSEKGNTYVL